MSDNLSKQSFSELPRSKKIAVFFLSIVAFGILGIWVWQFKARLDSPFIPDGKEAKLAQESYQKIITNTINDDTDGDGLSDSDEINIYQTSPYIEDTDGDGLSDAQEINSEQDPLCAKGETCGIVLVENNASSSIQSNISVDNNFASGVDENLLITALSGEGSIETLRLMLLQSGVDQEMLDSISDEDLMASYQTVLSNQNITDTN